MKKVKLLLENKSTFHFGDATGNLKIHFSSDQLVSALVNNVVLLYGNEALEQFINKMREGEIKFSSLYYGLDFLPKMSTEESCSIPFLPRPKIDFISRSDLSSFKKMKKVTYISHKLFQYLSKKCSCYEAVREVDVELPITVIGSRFAVLQEELFGMDISEHALSNSSFLKVITNPRVEVGRFQQQAENYFMQEDIMIQFMETDRYLVQPYMYFFYTGDLPKYVRAAVHLLSDEGIGGKRSLGRGFFKKVEWSEENHQLVHTGSLYINLSTYFPKKIELASLYNYELEKRNGYVYSFGGKTVRKRSVMVVQEGSIMRSKVVGEIIDIRPKGYKHPVYLNGMPILIGFGGERA